MIYLNRGERFQDMTDHRSYTQLKQLWNKAWNSLIKLELSSQLGAGHVVSSQYTCKLVQNTSEYMKDHMFELQRKIWRNDWSSQLYTA